jgi:hypothetical protein
MKQVLSLVIVATLLLSCTKEVVSTQLETPPQDSQDKFKFNESTKTTFELQHGGLLNPCSGDFIVLSGTVTLKEHLVYNANGHINELEFNYHDIIGTSVYTGAIYHVVGNNHFVQQTKNDDFPEGVNSSAHHRLKIWTPGIKGYFLFRVEEHFLGNPLLGGKVLTDIFAETCE